MRPQWLTVLGCLYLTGTVHPAAVSTPDTMVVTKVDDDATTKAPSTEVTSEAPTPAITLTKMEVTSNIALRYANTAVVATVHNPANRAQEYTFRVLLPETAFISGFTMILDGKPYKAYVKEKEEAKQIYNQAVSQGLGAAHVATKARDSNHLTVSVNIKPNSSGVFNLTYEELLARRHNVYNHAINMHPGAIVPEFTVTVNIKEQQKITTLRVPEVRTGNEIDATEDDEQNSSAEIKRCDNDYEATIIFKPTSEEQERLISIYREKTKDTRRPSYNYGYNPIEDKEENEGVLGQFVVQYDVERPKDGEILVNDGYFVHFFAPSDLPPLNKYVVFVLDTSGSMADRKIVQLREAMQTILGELNVGDYFNIVEFSTAVKVHQLSDADKEPQSNNQFGFFYNADQGTDLVPPSQATPENVAKAKVIVSRLNASGGTNIYSALDVAVTLTKMGIGWTGTVRQRPKSASSPATNTTTIAPVENETTDVAEDDINRPEPIIIFLTDGDPTVGEVNPTRIINHVSEANAGPNKASLFSLAFGEDADRKFLRKLSLRNDGFMRHIYEAADAALQLRAFYRQVASPLLADVRFIYPKKQIKEGSLTKHRFMRFYAGSETVVAGRIADDADELTPQVLGFCGVDNLNKRRPYEVLPKAPVPAKKDEVLPLERLWAHLTVKQLLDENDAIDGGNKSDPNSPYKKALEIALKYEFVTPLTSLVVVKPNATSAINAESVDKQNNGPLGLIAANYGAGGALAGPLPVYAPSAAGRPSHVYNYAPQAAFAFAGLPGPPAQMFHSFDYVAEDEDDGEKARRPPISTPRLPQPTSTTSKPTDELTVYHLEDYRWVSPLLANDSITLQVNSTTITLELSKDDVPKSADDTECEVSTDGEAGVCVYLTRCNAAKNISAETYSNTYCLVNDKYAGVCCPSANVDVEAEST